MNPFLNNNGIENTYNTVISHLSSRRYTNIFSPKMSLNYFSTKELNLFQSKEMMKMNALADVLRELPCQTYKFLFLKLGHCTKSVCIQSYSGPYSVRMLENTNQNNSECGHFLRSAILHEICKKRKELELYCITFKTCTL